MAKLVLCLGTNIGDRENNLIQAVHLLNKQFNSIFTFSPIYETSPWGLIKQDHFLNGVVYTETQHSPISCLNICMNIEQELGRTRVIKNEPRIIDIDILYYDQKIINEPNLKIPHLHIASRKFVLVPLNDLMPQFIDPIYHCSVNELLNKLNQSNDQVNFYKNLKL
ncbi:MAG: 2-amino-4-hydroxy-6-hydroxymethyldihydropteridine diphosphokinase [Alphaproteobacteria bacterium]|nr:2-amino-4-hydroxy-6-hydroxymethyldihydropteridine diphosphokinase [Alphaproteobacteria bacterium]